MNEEKTIKRGTDWPLVLNQREQLLKSFLVETPR